MIPRRDYTFFLVHSLRDIHPERIVGINDHLYPLKNAS